MRSKFWRENVKKRYPSCRWEDNVNIDVKGTECEGMGWFHLGSAMDQWLAHVNILIYLRIPYNAGNIFDKLSNFYLHKKDSAPFG
jgi:hypothetical protein